MTTAHVQPALAAVRKGNDTEIVGLLEKKLAAMPSAPGPAAVVVDPATLQSWSSYER